jgi:pimeloyl-ACP methyl ester carboxylesterase
VRAADLDVLVTGSGPRVVFVSGSIVDARRTWRHQLALADRFTLVVPERPGFGTSPPLERPDFELEAPLIAELLEDGAHLVGHSYGAIVALLAAAQRPDAVHSLTVSEPGLLRLGAGTPETDAMLAHGEHLYNRRGEMTPDQFVRFFRAGTGSTHETPEELPEWLDHGARLAMIERTPWEADVPFEQLEGIRALVISGGHSPMYERVCDVVAARLGAQRAVLPGRGHTIPTTGAAYNALVGAFLDAG